MFKGSGGIFHWVGWLAGWLDWLSHHPVVKVAFLLIGIIWRTHSDNGVFGIAGTLSTFCSGVFVDQHRPLHSIHLRTKDAFGTLGVGSPPPWWEESLGSFNLIIT